MAGDKWIDLFSVNTCDDVKLKAAFIYYRLQKANMKTQIRYFLHLFALFVSVFHLYVKEHLMSVVENCVGEEKKKEKH